MKLNELQQLLPDLDQNPHINHTVTIEDYYFRDPGKDDYRQRAIDFSIEHQISVTTTQNNGFELMRRYIKVRCPQCRKNMQSGTGFGNGGGQTLHYNCPCGVEFHLTIPLPGGINFTFKEGVK